MTLQGAASGHGINISDSVDDGVIVGSVEHGSPAHQSDRIARGNQGTIPRTDPRAHLGSGFAEGDGGLKSASAVQRQAVV